jgi:hypothetical protein
MVSDTVNARATALPITVRPVWRRVLSVSLIVEPPIQSMSCVGRLYYTTGFRICQGGSLNAPTHRYYLPLLPILYPYLKKGGAPPVESLYHHAKQEARQRWNLHTRRSICKRCVDPLQVGNFYGKRCFSVAKIAGACYIIFRRMQHGRLFVFYELALV